MDNIKIEDLDYFGRGVSHIDGKVTFIKNALKDEIVNVNIINSKKKYNEAVVTKYLNKNKNRIKEICPYFNNCGGCNLLHLNYKDTLTFKLNKVETLFKKNNIIYPLIELIANENNLYYRNKISLKIKNSKLGFYEEKTHNLVVINKCFIASPIINKVIENYKLLNIKDGTLTIRVNSNNEVLLVINSLDKNYNIDLAELKKIVKIVGIIYNTKTIYGNNFFYERLNNKLFKISYDAFFQVNPYICQKLFNLVKDNITKDSKVLDLYSGVGTLSIMASANAKEVIGIEIIKNAVLDGNFNAKINKINNIKFLLGDVSKILGKFNYDFDTLIIDPPRNGLDNDTLSFILNKKPKKIIYVSCDISTFIRDLKILEEFYTLSAYKILDMFSYTYHLESFSVLNRL